MFRVYFGARKEAQPSVQKAKNENHVGVSFLVKNSTAMSEWRRRGLTNPVPLSNSNNNSSIESSKLETMTSTSNSTTQEGNRAADSNGCVIFANVELASH